MGEDFVPGAGGVASQVQAFVVPALRKVREGRAPTVLVGAKRSKAKATRRSILTSRFLRR